MLEEHFFNLLFHRMRLLDGIRPDIIRAADAVIAAVTHGGRFMVYDENGQMNSESNYRNSGLKLPQNGMNGSGELLPVTPRDVVIVYCMLPATEQSLTALDTARDSGAYTIVVCPRTQGGVVPAGRTLAGGADIHLDNLSDADGIIIPDGWETPIAPTTGIINDVILWMLHGEIIDRMIQRGMTPGVLRGSHLRGGRPWNHAVPDSLMRERGW